MLLPPLVFPGATLACLFQGLKNLVYHFVTRNLTNQCMKMLYLNDSVGWVCLVVHKRDTPKGRKHIGVGALAPISYTIEPY
jgi:hypothetical protein